MSTRPSKPLPTRVEHLPPYKVVLHNDDSWRDKHVVEKIKSITRLSDEESKSRAAEAKKNGTAVLLVTHLERAELYAEQFLEAKIKVTYEPVK